MKAAAIGLSPKLVKEARRRLLRKTRAATAATPPATVAAEAQTAVATMEALQNAVAAEPLAADRPPDSSAVPPAEEAAVPMLEQAAPATPDKVRVSGRQKAKVVQLLWEDLPLCRQFLGPDMACHVVGAAIRAVELVQRPLVRGSDRQLAGAFLNVGAALAGGQLRDEVELVRAMHPDSPQLEHDIMQAMSPYMP